MRLMTRAIACRRYGNRLARVARLTAVLWILLLPASLRAQSNSGALDLLFPIGARATAMGTAFVAEQGSESVWWNPAGLARLTAPEMAIDHFQNFVVKGDAISFVLPAAPVGVFALTARLFNYGDTEGRDNAGNDTGSIANRSIVLGGRFAAAMGKKFEAGVAFHLYRGQSGGTTFSTSAVDAGVQYQPSTAVPLRFGVEVRNLGLDVQVHDLAQADALPTRVHLGASYDPVFAQLPREFSARATAEVVTTGRLAQPEFRVGGQLGYAAGTSRLVIRAGYIKQPDNGSLLTGPSLGLGLVSGRVQLDLARIFESFSSALDVPPTYISIRVGL